MLKRALLLALLLGLAGDWGSASAFEGFEAERPFLSSTSQALEQGIYQLEQGVRYEAGTASTLTFPSLHRLGLGSDAELMLETPIVTIANGETRLADLSVGGKWRFAGGGGFPSLGVVGLAEVGAEGQVLPRATLALDVPLPGAFKLESNLGASWKADSSAWLHYSAALGWNILDALELCAEVTGEATPEGPHVGVDGGLGWLMDPSTQLDVLLYKGMTPQAAEWSAALGLSRRWGN